jgi:hypothetical protein
MTGFLKTKLSDKNFLDTVFIPEELEDLLAEYEINMPLCGKMENILEARKALFKRKKAG